MSLPFKSLALVFFIGSLMAPPSHAHGGGNEGNFCRIYVEQYGLMVSSYQPSISESDVHCANLPTFAPSVIVFDIVDKPLRKIPLSAQIIQLTDTMENGQDKHHGKTVSAVPFDLHDSGTIQLTFTPEKNTQYAAILTTIDKNGYPEVVHFPLSIGKSKAGITPFQFASVILFIMFCGVFFAVFGHTIFARKK